MQNNKKGRPWWPGGSFEKYVEQELLTTLIVLGIVFLLGLIVVEIVKWALS